ncbi:MAG: peptide chain release factor N(5)-glutamine methyltransferase [Phototrophicaceae bacterium]
MVKTIRDALQIAYQQLHPSHTKRLDAQLLLCHLLNVEKPYLVTHDDRILSNQEITDFQALIARRQNDEPVAYILGYKHFWDLVFAVSPAVLIPRPETEHLIEAALEWVKGKNELIVADIGTGSGAIAVTIAKHTNATVYAVDISPAALEIARKNATDNQVDIHFHEGSLASPLIEQAIKVDLLLANLPYIRADVMPDLPVTKHEPSLALVGGEDGLDLVRDLILQIPQVCNPNALILLEIGMEQYQAVREFAEAHLVTKDIRIIKDLAGLDRIVAIQL